MEVRKCTKEDYPALLDVFNDAFKHGRETEWFQKNWTHCTPYPSMATPEEIGRHWLCIIDGHIAGGLGAYPMNWVVSNSDNEQRTVSAYGIGQVACMPEFRNQGVMSALMKASAADMKMQGYTVGYLSGNRRRYGYFGYDIGGNTVKYRLDTKLLKNAAAQGITTRTAKLSDWPEINRAYETQPSYVMRSPRMWELHFARESTRWLIGERDGRKGYICAPIGHDISEVYGDPGVLAAMLLEIADTLDEDKTLQLYHSAQDVISTPVGQMLYNAAAKVESYPAGMLAIVNAAKLLDELQIDHTGISNADKEAMAHRLFNFAPLPGKLQGAQPLCAWIPGTDSI